MKSYIAMIVTFLLLISFLQYKDSRVENFTNKPAIASMKAMTVIADFKKEETKPIEAGLYRSIGVADDEKYVLDFYITSDTITKTLTFNDSDIILEAAANYTYDGSVIKYSNTQGNLMLFTAQGEPFINRPDNKFALIGECSLEAEQYLNDHKSVDVMCRDGVEISEFTKIVEKRVVKPIAFDHAAK